MIEKLLSKMRARLDFSREEEDILRSAMSESRHFRRNEIIVPEDQPISFSSLLIEGFAARTKYLENGTRQIMEIGIPGDFVDLHSYPLERLDHSVTAITSCRILKMPHKNITGLMERQPRIARTLWFSTMVDSAIHREWLVSLGSRNALQRIAHMFCELFYRMRIVGLTENSEFHLPLTQIEIAEASGLTPVHVNRMLKKLRDMGLAEWDYGKIQILDREGLEETAMFDPGYLYLEGPGGGKTARDSSDLSLAAT